MFVDEPQMTAYDIYRETTEGASKLNRLCMDVNNVLSDVLNLTKCLECRILFRSNSRKSCNSPWRYRRPDNRNSGIFRG